MKLNALQAWHLFRKLSGRRCAYQTFVRWVETGLISAVRYGGQWSIEESEVRRYVAEGNEADGMRSVPARRAT